MRGWDDTGSVTAPTLAWFCSWQRCVTLQDELGCPQPALQIWDGSSYPRPGASCSAPHLFPSLEEVWMRPTASPSSPCWYVPRSLLSLRQAAWGVQDAAGSLSAVHLNPSSRSRLSGSLSLHFSESHGPFQTKQSRGSSASEGKQHPFQDGFHCQNASQGRRQPLASHRGQGSALKSPLGSDSSPHVQGPSDELC